MSEAQSRPPGPPPGPDRDQPEAVGKYRIIRRLGEGGMGSVFLARDTVLRREVALKLPLVGTENDPEVRERFLREARSAATLDHPYICRVHDADEVDGRLYLAMAYIEGRSLADLVRAEGMPPRQVVALVGKLAIALQEAHAHGVVHRDLKPRNVMIREVGSKREPVIVDFGLARLEGPEDVRMTRTGQAMGTPAYMAPEQLRGNPDEIGPPCDIYALGVILHELLTGRLPFVGPYPVLVAQILTQAPLPPSTHRPGLDGSLDAICLRAMAKDVSGRYASMMELATALTGYLRDARPNSTSDSPAARITRPVEGDSIPTGADTLVSRLLGPDDTEGRPPKLPMPEKAGSSPRTLMGRRPPRAILMASVILGLFLVAGIIVVFTNRGGGRPRLDGTPIVKKSGEDRPRLDGTPIVTSSVGDRPMGFAESIGIKILPLPTGKFLMGSPDSDKDASSDEKPQHRVTIPAGRGLAAHEVTVGQFRRFVADTNYQTEAERDGKGGYGLDADGKTFKQDPKFSWLNPGYELSDDHPVGNVSWNDAVEFCRWLTRKDGRTYRLPTEAEWEYACRAGTQTRYVNGDDPEQLARVGNVRDASAKRRFPDWIRAIAGDDGYVFTAPVGRFERNPWGFFDLHGNAWEWCLDNYDANYYKSSPSADPHGPSTAASRVLRGGGWSHIGLSSRSAGRLGFVPASRYDGMGFRVARVPPGQ